MARRGSLLGDAGIGTSGNVASKSRRVRIAEVSEHSGGGDAMMTDEELAIIVARHQRASRGFWLQGDHSAELRVHDHEGTLTTLEIRAESSPDVQAVIHYWQDIDDLLADGERLRAQNAAIRELLSEAYGSWFYREEASYPPPPWVYRAMALLVKEGTR